MAPDSPTSVCPEGLLVMGVAGSGKSTVAALVAGRLGWDFLDADDFHPPANKEKMSAGIPLSDEDRAPWLELLNALLVRQIAANRHPVLACSALREKYRAQVTAGNLPVAVVFLRGTFEEILVRMNAREGHFMPRALLESQFAVLEEPTNAWVFDIATPAEAIAAEIATKMVASRCGS